MKFAKSIIAVSTLALLVGCASTGPAGVGAGYGAQYTPVIDGPQDSKYWTDLGQCRQLATDVQRNRDAETANKAVAGALAGALIGGMLGGKGYRNESAGWGAKAGLLSGVGEGEANAASGGKAVIVRCMMGRGYRVLANNDIVDDQGTRIAAHDNIPMFLLESQLAEVRKLQEAEVMPATAMVTK